jgi:Zn-dependent peptidase ImmA (M78 family)/DNA-binding XRE family transcriptional regulator
MPHESPHINVKPEMIKWLRESSGWTLEDVSRTLNISVEQIGRWESGIDKPTLNELKRIARAFHRPLAAFFLPRPVEAPPLPTDLRKLPGEEHPFTKKTLLAIRKARNLQSASEELLKNLDASLDPDILPVSIKESPESIGKRERIKSGISVEDQFKWRGAHEAFRLWREWIESKNILVFQFPMDIEELRGLTLMDKKPYAIVINSSDSIQARIFTLMHEYAHILIDEPALCTPDNPTTEPHGANVEAWCNSFAGAFLAPKEIFSDVFEEMGIARISSLSNRFKISLSAILTRALVCKLISKRDYDKEISKLAFSNSKKGGGSGETSDEKAFRERGATFVSLVLENSEKGYITNNEALSYLDIKTHHLEKLIKSPS